MVNSGSFDASGSEGESVKAEFTQLENDAAEASFSAVVPETAQTDVDINSGKQTKTSLQCSVPLDKVKNVLELCTNKSKLSNLFILENYLQKKSELTSETTESNKPVAKRLLCLFCDRTFTSNNLKQKHVDRCHSSGQTRRSSSRTSTLNQSTTACCFCNKLNNTEHTLKELLEHLIDEHSNRYHACLSCQERFSSIQSLRDHNVSIHGLQEPVESKTSSLSAETNIETVTGLSAASEIIPQELKRTCTNTSKGDNIVPETPKESPDLPSPSTTKQIKRTSSLKIASNSETKIEETKPKEPVETREDFEDAIQVNLISQQEAKKLKPPEIDDEDVVLAKRVKNSTVITKTKTSKKSQIVNNKISVKSTKNGLRSSLRTTRASVKQMSSFNKTRKNKIDKNNRSESNKQIVSKKHRSNPSSVFSLVNAYIYKYEKIYDHSSDSIKDANSVQFNAVFDKDFYSKTVCNIRDNLLHHLDGKLNRNIESENRISNFEHNVSESEAKLASDGVDNFGCELSLNAVTPVATLLNSSQYGEDFDAQIEYGAKASQKKAKKVTVVKYKFPNKKYNSLFRKNDSQHDLTYLDMWTQLSVKTRQHKFNSDHFIEDLMNYQRPTGESKYQVEELNQILDKRGPFEDLQLEANAAQFVELRKKSAKEGDYISEEAANDVFYVLDDLLNRVMCKTNEEDKLNEEVKEEEPEADENQQNLSNYLQLQRTSSSDEIRIDPTDSIALICSSQDENEVNQKKRLELTGEWARPRIYICATCGQKLPNYKSLEDHKNLNHPQIWCSHYEFVGNQSQIYRNLSIPGLGKVGCVESLPVNRQWQRSDARVCSKCTKHCHNLGELHKHILECGGDWTWMLARKKCKYRPYGARTRRRRQRGYKRSCNPEVTRAREHKAKIKPIFIGPRPKPSKPSDAETIERMLANLPPKRNRKMISMRDGIQRPRKPYKQKLINQNSSSQSNKKGHFKSSSSQIKQTLRNALKRKITNNLRKQNKNDSDSDTPISLRTIVEKDGDETDNKDNAYENDITKHLMNKRTKLRNTRMISRILGSKIFDNNSTIVTRRKIAKAIAQNNIIRKTRLRSKMNAQHLLISQKEEELAKDSENKLQIKNKTSPENEKKAKVGVKSQNSGDDSDPKSIKNEEGSSKTNETEPKTPKKSNAKRILSVLTKANKKAKIPTAKIVDPIVDKSSDKPSDKPDTINAIIDEVIKMSVNNELFRDKMDAGKNIKVKNKRPAKNSSSLSKIDPNLNKTPNEKDNIESKNDNKEELNKNLVSETKAKKVVSKKPSKLLQNVKSFKKSFKKSNKNGTEEKSEGLKSKLIRTLSMKGSKRKKTKKEETKPETVNQEADLKKTTTDVSNHSNEPESESKTDAETLVSCDKKKSECETDSNPVVMPILEKIEPLPLNVSSETSVKPVPILCPVNEIIPCCENQQIAKSESNVVCSASVLTSCDKTNTNNSNNAVNKFKSKMKRSGRGLNDCIAMLRCKLEQKYSSNEPSLVDKSNLFILNSSEVIKHSQPVVQEHIDIVPTSEITKDNRDISINSKTDEESTSKVIIENAVTKNESIGVKNEQDKPDVKNINVLEIPSIKSLPKSDVSTSEMSSVETQTQTADDDITSNSAVDYIPTNIQTNLQLSYVLNATLQNCLMECVKNKCETFKIENQNYPLKAKLNQNKVATKIGSVKKRTVKTKPVLKETLKEPVSDVSVPVLLNTAFIENIPKKAKSKTKSNPTKVFSKAASDTSDDDVPLSKLVLDPSSTKIKVKLPVDKKKRSSKKQIAFTPLILNSQDNCVPQISLQERIEQQVKESASTEITSSKEINNIKETTSNEGTTNENVIITESKKGDAETVNNDDITNEEETVSSVQNGTTSKIIEKAETNDITPVDLSIRSDSYSVKERNEISQKLPESNELKEKNIEDSCSSLNSGKQQTNLNELGKELVQENTVKANISNDPEKINNDVVEDPTTAKEIMEPVLPLSQQVMAIEDEPPCDSFLINKTLTEANIKPPTPQKANSSDNIEFVNKINHLDNGKENTERQVIKKQKRVVRKQKTKRKRGENKAAQPQTEICEPEPVENNITANVDQPEKSENDASLKEQLINVSNSDVSGIESSNSMNDTSAVTNLSQVTENADLNLSDTILDKVDTYEQKTRKTRNSSKSETEISNLNNDVDIAAKVTPLNEISKPKLRRIRNISKQRKSKIGLSDSNTSISADTSLEESPKNAEVNKPKTRTKRNKNKSINSETEINNSDADTSLNSSLDQTEKSNIDVSNIPTVGEPEVEVNLPKFRKPRNVSKSINFELGNSDPNNDTPVSSSFNESAEVSKTDDEETSNEKTEDEIESSKQVISKKKRNSTKSVILESDFNQSKDISDSNMSQTDLTSKTEDTSLNQIEMGNQKSRHKRSTSKPINIKKDIDNISDGLVQPIENLEIKVTDVPKEIFQNEELTSQRPKRKRSVTKLFNIGSEVKNSDNSKSDQLEEKSDLNVSMEDVSQNELPLNKPKSKPKRKVSKVVIEAEADNINIPETTDLNQSVEQSKVDSADLPVQEIEFTKPKNRRKRSVVKSVNIETNISSSNSDNLKLEPEKSVNDNSYLPNDETTPSKQGTTELFCINKSFESELDRTIYEVSIGFNLEQSESNSSISGVLSDEAATANIELNKVSKSNKGNTRKPRSRKKITDVSVNTNIEQSTETTVDISSIPVEEIPSKSDDQTIVNSVEESVTNIKLKLPLNSEAAKPKKKRGKSKTVETVPESSECIDKKLDSSVGEEKACNSSIDEKINSKVGIHKKRSRKIRKGQVIRPEAENSEAVTEISDSTNIDHTAENLQDISSISATEESSTNIKLKLVLNKEGQPKRKRRSNKALIVPTEVNEPIENLHQSDNLKNPANIEAAVNEILIEQLDGNRNENKNCDESEVNKSIINIDQRSEKDKSTISVDNSHLIQEELVTDPKNDAVTDICSDFNMNPTIEKENSNNIVEITVDETPKSDEISLIPNDNDEKLDDIVSEAKAIESRILSEKIAILDEKLTSIKLKLSLSNENIVKEKPIRKRKGKISNTDDITSINKTENEATVAVQSIQETLPVQREQDSKKPKKKRGRKKAEINESISDVTLATNLDLPVSNSDELITNISNVTNEEEVIPLAPQLPSDNAKPKRRHGKLQLEHANIVEPVEVLDQPIEQFQKPVRKRGKSKTNISEANIDELVSDVSINSDLDQSAKTTKKPRTKRGKKSANISTDNDSVTDVSGNLTEDLAQVSIEEIENSELSAQNQTESKIEKPKTKRGRKKTIKTNIAEATINVSHIESENIDITCTEVNESTTSELKQSTENIENSICELSAMNHQVMSVKEIDHYDFNLSAEEDLEPIKERPKRKRRSRIDNLQLDVAESITDIPDIAHETAKNDELIENIPEILVNDLIQLQPTLEDIELKPKKKRGRKKANKVQEEVLSEIVNITDLGQTESIVEDLCNTTENVPENLTDTILASTFISQIQLTAENEPELALMESKEIQNPQKISIRIKPIKKLNIAVSDSEDELPLAILLKNKPQDSELPIIEEDSKLSSLEMEFDNDIDDEIVQSLELNKIIEDVISNNDEESALNIENISDVNLIDINNEELSKFESSLEDSSLIPLEDNNKEMLINQEDIDKLKDDENKITEDILPNIEINEEDEIQNENMETQFDEIENFEKVIGNSNDLILDSTVNQQTDNIHQPTEQFNENLVDFLQTPSNKQLDDEPSFITTPDLADTSLKIKIKTNLNIKIRKPKKTRRRVIPKSLSKNNMRRKEKEREEEDLNASFFCDICKKTFKRKENLSSHKKTLTHIAKLSEIEARENMLKKKEENEEYNEKLDVEDLEKEEMMNQNSEKLFEEDNQNVDENIVAEDDEETEINKITEDLKLGPIGIEEDILVATDSIDGNIDPKTKENILDETNNQQYNLAEMDNEENDLKIIEEDLLNIEEKALEKYSKEIIEIDDESLTENDEMINNKEPAIEEILDIEPRKSNSNLLPNLMSSNNTNLKLVDIISEVLDKPVNDLNMRDIDYLPQSIANACDSNEKYSEPKRYKSLGERKSFDSDNFNLQPKSNQEITKENYNTSLESVNNGLLSKQLSLLENIIEENNPNLNYIDDSISLSSNQFEEPVEHISKKDLFKPEYSKPNDPQVKFSHSSAVLSNFIKPNSHFNNFVNISASFAKPTKQTELNTKHTFENEELKKSKDNSKRKILNRDEELFLECCSLLKSGSEIAVSKKSTRNIPLNTFSRSNDASWTIQKPQNSEQFIQRDSYSWLAQSSRVDTPIGEPFVNTYWSNSNSGVSSEWLAQKARSPDRPTENNTLLKKSNNNSGETTYSDIQFEDISIDTSLETSKTLMAIDNSNTENVPLDFHHLNFSNKNLIEKAETQQNDPQDLNKSKVDEFVEDAIEPEDDSSEGKEEEDKEDEELKIDEDEENKEEFDSDLKKRVVSAFGGLMAKALTNRLHAVVRRSKKARGKRDFASAIQASITDYAVPVKKNKVSHTDSDSSDCPKKLMTKGAMKVFEGLKVSIPTQDLNLKEVLNCSSKLKNGETVEIETEATKNDEIKDVITEKSNEKIPEETSKNGRLKKLFGRFGNKLGLRETKKKPTKHRNKSKNNGKNRKTHDVYEFEESVDSNFMFKAGKFSLFRHKEQNFEKIATKVSEEKINTNGNESESDTDRYYDSMSFEEMSLSSESSQNLNRTKPVPKKSSEKSKENQKKCMIMGRIFKNASKPKLEDKIPEIRDISSEENSKLVENFIDNYNTADNIANTKQDEVSVTPNNVTVVNNSANKMTKVEMDLLFDKLLQEEKKHTESNMASLVLPVEKDKLSKEINNEMLPPPIMDKKKIKDGKSKTPGKLKKRQRHNSGDSTSSEEFTLTGKQSKSSKKHHKTPRKSTKPKKDTGINLEQEMKECIGVAGRKSQRKCTSGKQNVLIEVWSSDESSFEDVIKMLTKENEAAAAAKGNNKTEIIEESSALEEVLENSSSSSNPVIPTAEIVEPQKPTIDIYDFESDAELKQDVLKIKIKLSDSILKQDSDFIASNKIKIPKKVRRISKNRKHSKSHGEESDAEYEAERARRREHKRKKMMENNEMMNSGMTPESLAATRKKRNAGDQLYYWSSSSEDEFQDLIEVKPIREDTEDDRPMQHGWIVGDSPKKLVTMLAQAKGKKVEGESVKEQKKNRVTL